MRSYMSKCLRCKLAVRIMQPKADRQHHTVNSCRRCEG